MSAAKGTQADAPGWTQGGWATAAASIVEPG